MNFKKTKSLWLSAKASKGEMTLTDLPISEKTTGAEMCPAIVSGIVSGDTPCYWILAIFSPDPNNSPTNLRNLTRPSYPLVFKVTNRHSACDILLVKDRFLKQSYFGLS